MLRATGGAGSVGVIGGGTMGLGIAYVFAITGWRTTIVEPDPDRAGELVATICARAGVGVERGRLDSARLDALPALVAVVGAIHELPHKADLVVETVPERLDLKRDVLAAAQEREPSLLASNTSALSIDELAAGLRAPERFFGMHFFNPVWSIPLVEIVRGEVSAAASIEAARSIACALGKEPIVVRNVPGFATSRLDNISAFEAMRMLEEGVADAADIDRALMLGYGHPIGPLRLSDVVGLDVRLDIARTLEARYGERYAPPQILIDLVAAGHLGRKAGRGFFDWTGEN
ncbi:MAG: 3-hydroxyacyl-CoA dehydrogenase family protein [Sporichthyaceae bacterium]